jgi:hypothetical protein
MDQEQHNDEEPVKTTVRIPESVIADLKKAGKLHRRNFNNELVVALEFYWTMVLSDPERGGYTDERYGKYA